MYTINGKVMIDLEPYLNIDAIDETLLQTTLGVYSRKIEVCYAQELTVLPPYKETDTLGNMLVLTTIDKYANKHLKSKVSRRQLTDDFQFIFDWIDAQDCFQEYGRVMFFFSEPNSAGKIHRDYPEHAIHSPSDMFLWISGPVEKRIFVYDKDTGEKVYSPSRAVIFDNCNFHGTENLNDSTAWSLRVDGIFKKEWAEKVGIYDHFQSVIDQTGS